MLGLCTTTSLVIALVSTDVSLIDVQASLQNPAVPDNKMYRCGRQTLVHRDSFTTKKNKQPS